MPAKQDILKLRKINVLIVEQKNMEEYLAINVDMKKMKVVKN